MSYKYFTSGSPTYFSTPKETWVSGFDALLADQFSNASDVFVIQEEYPFSTGSYISLDVRVNAAIDNLTGEKMGDDFKTLLFPSLTYAAFEGEKFYFDSNYFLCVNTRSLKTLAASCMVRRCNNILRWGDEYGNTYSEHCIIDYKIASPRNKDNIDPIVSEGTIKIFCQLNARTRTIKENQRFLFGNTSNWMAYSVYGGGIVNFLNDETEDNTSAKMLELTLGKNFVNEDEDDIVNGIAGCYKNTYTIITSPSSILGGINDSFLLNSIVYLNDNPVTKVVTYTSNSATASVSGSIVTLLATGSCIITARLQNNTNITDTVSVIVSGSIVENDVRFSPPISNLLQGDTQIFTCYNYNNGTQQSGSFLFTASGSAPIANYVLTTLGDNSFSLKNAKLYLEDPLVIHAVSGSITGQLGITLRGGW